MGYISLVDILSDIIEKQARNRSAFLIKELVPLVKPLPFFKERGLKDNSIQETISLMEYKEMKQDQFAIEYGTFGDEFYVVLDGEVEVMVPDTSSDTFKLLTREMRMMQEELKKVEEEIKSVEAYRDQMANKKKMEEKINKAKSSMFVVERRYTAIIDNQIPATLNRLYDRCEQLI